MFKATDVMFAIAVVGVGCDSGNDDSGVPDPCGPSDLYDEYLPGMEKVGDRLTVALERARPAPPEKGDNQWEISVSDAAHQPVDDLEIVVLPFMPDHGHGTSTDPAVRGGETSGEYVIEDIALVMGGRWEVTLTLDDGAPEPDEVVFAFCVLD